MANQQEIMKFFRPRLLAELAMDDDFTEVLFRLNSSDDDFNFILQAVKTMRNIKILKQDGYSEGQYLYATMKTLDHFIFEDC